MVSHAVYWAESSALLLLVCAVRKLASAASWGVAFPRRTFK